MLPHSFYAAIRFVLTLSVVCNRCFQSPALRKHAGVGLVLCGNVADSIPLSLVNQGLLVSFQASPFREGWLTNFPPFSPITCTKNTNSSALVDKTDSHHHLVNLAKTIMALFVS